MNRETRITPDVVIADASRVSRAAFLDRIAPLYGHKTRAEREADKAWRAEYEAAGFDRRAEMLTEQLWRQAGLTPPELTKPKGWVL